VLWGGLAATCTRLKDINGVVGSFFVFPDLSVRSSGAHRLKFELFVMNITGAKMTPIASTSSDIFTAYTPKSFPGILETTSLSRWFAKQGVRVRLRQTGENPAD
ncbi:velvet factor, partial [Chytriomyces cf. hyalinus JEL632]